MIQMAK